MKIFSQILLASSLIVAGGTGQVFAQDGVANASYQVSELRLNRVPVPTERPGAKLETVAIETVAAPATAIRRTDDGIRIVGPRFFPAN